MTATAIHTHPPTDSDDRRRRSRPAQLAWLAGGLALSFAIPYVGSDVLELPLTGYYLCYFVLTLTFLSAYVRTTEINVGALLRRRWRTSLILGVLAGVLVITRVLSEVTTPGPSGIRFAFELIWRGAAYGTVDALLLTAFPCLVTLSLVGGNLSGAIRKLAYVACSMVLILTITTVYHLGFEQFRRDGISAPLIGNTMISMPMLVTTNPIGSILAHASMHIAATTHAYETPTFLPPQSAANGDRFTH
ncbi:hypothetical protein [Pengzhenrongella phosphoraccumulans]|uniref:hypothetical protein n=1 Tax=Pengzhenrongella phosphoraccumulans TaxID=3114394 RepID=UPI00388E70AB